MKKKTKKRQRSRVTGILLVAAVLFLLLDAVLIWRIRSETETDRRQISGQQPMDTTALETSSEATLPETTEAMQEREIIELPVILEDGRLHVLSLFQYSGPNPDCGDREGRDIAAVLLENTSQQHLSRAEFEIVTASGSVLRFVAEDIPAGQTAMVFSADNATVEVDPGCAEITCNAVFKDFAPLMEGTVSVTINGTTVRVVNISGEDLVNVAVYYHNVMDPEYYGGLTYQYLVESLPAGGSAEFDAWECFFGTAEVVRIELQDQTGGE